MKPGWRIETGTVADIPLILPLVHDVQNLHATALPGRFIADADEGRLTQFFSEVLAEGGTLLLARDAKAGVIGYLLWTVDERFENAFRNSERAGMLDQICVTQTARRQGVAQALIAVMKDQMRAVGLLRWVVTYWDFNAASAALMQSVGASPAVFRAEGLLSETD